MQTKEIRKALKEKKIRCKVSANEECSVVHIKIDFGHWYDKHIITDKVMSSLNYKLLYVEENGEEDMNHYSAERVYIDTTNEFAVNDLTFDELESAANLSAQMCEEISKITDFMREQIRENIKK